MTLDGFNNLMIKIVDNLFPLRDIPLSVNASLRVVVNELEGDKIFQLSFPEFLEAFCRVIDKYSPIPPDQNSEEWTMENRQAQPLNVKLDNVAGLLSKFITHPDYKLIKDKFGTPMKDEIGLYKYAINNNFYVGVMPVPGKKGKRGTVINQRRKTILNNLQVAK
jgi:hypothetical protein